MSGEKEFKHPDVRLEVSGKLYGGWTKISITRGIDQMAGAFQLEVTERWPGQSQLRFVEDGAPCRVLVDDEPVITGYVDNVSISYDANSHTVTASGRDKTADLVDCCPPSTQLTGQSIISLAKKLCEPFGINVVSSLCLPLTASVKTNEGDTVYELLRQQAAAAAVLLYSNGAGDLVINRAGSEKAGAGLELGKNIKQGSFTRSARERFSEYIVRGQSAASDNWAGPAAAHPKGVASDPLIKRHRPLNIVAEQESMGVSAQQRAQWEANSRYGKGRNANYTVNGWYGGSILWQPNHMVTIKDSFACLNEEWLIVSVTWSMDASGWISQLTVQPKEAYDTPPVKAPQE